MIKTRLNFGALLIMAMLVFSGCTNNKSKKNTETGSESTNAELVKAAKDAYIFSYPMVMMYRSMYLQAIDKETGVGMGNYLHLGVSTPKDTTIVTPNIDSPYSYAWVDLRTEPYVISLPKIEKDRFNTVQWDDMYGYVLDNVGSVNDGNDGVNVLLVSPDYKGELPEGINRMIKGDSYIMGTLTRTQLIGMDDLPRVKEIQNQYKLQPLSAFLGKEAPKSAPVINWKKWNEGSEKNMDFWGFSGFVSQFLVKDSSDDQQWENLAKFGFKKGEKWDVSTLSPEKKAALKEGQKLAYKHLEDLSTKPFDPKDFFNTREKMKGDYEQLALGVWVGIFGNTTNQSVYYSFQKDTTNKLTDASKTNYTLTFKKDELPDVKYFWSLTMYNLPQRWVIANALDRYSIGSANPEMKLNKDGSLTIYIQKTSPGKEKEGNWLPAPDGPFWTVLRCYGPAQNIIEGTWPVPQLSPSN